MNKKTWIKIGMGSIIGVYAVFLASPLVLNPIINGYCEKITDEIHKTTGLNAKLTNVKLVTTPKLTAGLGFDKFELFTPDNEQIASADDFQVKMSLLPVLAGKIELDIISLKNADITIKVNKDGSYEVMEYLPQNESADDTQASGFKLPLGFKFSNHLPDIKLENYSITLTDGVDNYTAGGNRTEVTDFIINKSIKVKTSGKAVFKGREQFSYNLNIKNKIMPDIDLNEVLENPLPADEEKKEAQNIDIIGILSGIYYNNLTAKADADLTIERENINGRAEISNVSILNLPPSDAKLIFKGKSIDVLTNIYTAKNEVSKIDGVIKTGSKPKIDLNFKSKAELANILRIVKETALIFNIKDLQTLSAEGKIDADFNVKSDLHSVKSNGYLRIPDANVYYGAYKIGVDNINADVKLNNNNINIDNIGFSVLNQPLKFTGTIKETAECELHLTADRLNLKGLLVALGQAGLMKDNQVNSGLISMNADISGRLDKINPLVKINLDNVNIKNIPSNTAVKLPKTVLNITSDGKTFGGNAESEEIKLINPALTVSVPKLTTDIKETEINIPQTPVTAEKINFNVSGKIVDYLTETPRLNFVTSGDIKSALAGDINVLKQTLNLNYATTSPSTIIIPMFDQSEMTLSGNVAITGSMMNPVLNGNINIPLLNIPEIPVTMTNTDITLSGRILTGKASAARFASGGITAENLTADFALRGENFYLKNLAGTSFDGKINGNIIYKITNAGTKINLKAEGMNAQKAVLGAVGIKNAISGTLGFDTKLALTVADYNEMMKSLNGDLTFNVKNGAFGSIGRLENFLNAGNIIGNSILKTTASTLKNTTGLSDTAKFDYLEGKLSFKDGWADINPIKSSGSSLAYYITGKYNLLNGTTNIKILGRLDGTIVAKLGPLGELSADKLLGYIPKFGSLTASIANALTENPDGENTDAIPALTSGSTSYKDFKVLFNGGLESTSSVKSFKWLTDIDTSAIETKSVKETLEEIKTSVNEDLSNTVKSVTDAVAGSKEQWNSTKEQLKNSAEEILNLFKSKPAQQSDTVSE